MTTDGTPVTTYHYPPRVAPQPVTLHGLDAVAVANASERTAPRRRTPLEAAAMRAVGSWAEWREAPRTAPEYDRAARALHDAMTALSEELG
jgi:hypothetical protein